MSFTDHEARVLEALAPGGQLTFEQIADLAEISVRSVRKALNLLAGKGLTASGRGLSREAWNLTSKGEKLAASPHGRAILDVPRVSS